MIHNPLDITKFAEMNSKELKEAITVAVQATQGTSILVPLPDLLYLRQDQFKSLSDDPALQDMRYDKQRIYVTPLNAMELRVKK